MLRGTSSHQSAKKTRPAPRSQGVGMREIRSTQRSLPHPRGSRAMSSLEPSIRKPVAVKKKTKTTRRSVVAVSPLQVGSRARNGGITSLECSSISSEQLGQYAVSEVQGLAQGERIGVASQRKDGFVSSRLLRCPVPGGKVKPRRREDIGSNGVSFSRVQGPFATQSESLEGVEKAHSNKEQVASSKIGCLWDSNANDGEEREGYGHHGPSELRSILEAGRSHEPDRKECHSASDWSRRAISTLHGGDQRRRRIASRQDRGVQQFHSPRQSSHSQLVGKGSAQSEGDGRRQWWDLPVQVGGLPEAISEKRELARIAKSSCLPTSTWRSLRRLVLKAERPQRGQGKGKMADRHFSAALCQGKIQNLLSRMPKLSIQYCHHSVQIMEKVMMGRAAPIRH